MSTRYQELCKALEDAREQFGAYRSNCVWFAATLARGLTDYAAWPRELVRYEPLGGPDPARPTERIEDAIQLDQNAFWGVGLRLSLEEPEGKDTILLELRFKKLPDRYLISLFGVEDFEVKEPTADAMQPIYESILTAVKRHYENGLRLFLENGGRGLKIPISKDRLLEMWKGAGKPG